MALLQGHAIASILYNIIIANVTNVGCDDGFPCDNGECTSSIFDRCDSVRDCSDGSDEDNCGKTCHNLAYCAVHSY